MHSSHAFWNVNITNYWFVAALAVITVALGVGTALTWEWRRFKIFRRITGIFATQIMVTATLAAVINVQADFYGSPSELIAALGGAGPAVPHTNVPTKYVGTLAANHVTPHSFNQRAQHQHGLIISTNIRGAVTGYDLPADIYLPSAYFSPAYHTRRFPVVELNDGYPGSPYLWLHTMDLGSVLNHLIDTHRIPPMIVVLPTQNPVAGRDSECVNAVDGSKAATYLGVDVPAAVARQFRTAPTRTGWGILGYSTGGFCAVNTALNYPERFSAAASLSGYFKPLTDITTGDIYHGDTGAILANTPMSTVEHHRGGPMHFYVFASNAEKSGHEVSGDREFASRVRRPDTVHPVVVPTGGHNFQTWDLALPGAFEWLAHELRVAPSTGLPSVATKVAPRPAT